MRQNWVCLKCDSMYLSPIKASQVVCEKCSRKVGGKETWMTEIQVLDLECKIQTGE